MKIPYEKYELKLTSGKINDFNFKIISDYADIRLNNPSFDKKGISFRKENLALEYEKVDYQITVLTLDQSETEMLYEIGMQKYY